MRIEKLDLDDFGCFTRARLSDLGDGLTVIAGPQRAGKTTLMEAVRHLGYGISRGDDIPPASSQYDVTADIVVDTDRYELSVNGYADPSLTPLNGGVERTPREIYGGLRKTQYQQLYTISLEELRRVPHSIDSTDNLSSILLDAAYGNIREVPEIRDRLGSTAKSIGGKHGRGVYQMGDPMDEIEAGIAKKEAALKQVDEYEHTQNQHDSICREIDSVKSDIEELETEQTKLNAVITVYDDFDALQALNRKLAEANTEDVDSFPIQSVEQAQTLANQYESATSALDQASDKFKTKTGAEAAEEYLETLLDAETTIETYASEISGWKTQLEQLKRRRDEIQDQEDKLRNRVGSLNTDWNNDLETVRECNLDVFSVEYVHATAEKWKEARDDVEDLQYEIEELASRHEDLATRIENAVGNNDGTGGQAPLRSFGAGSALAVIGGVVTSVLAGAIAGILVTTLIFLVTGAYIHSKADDQVKDEGVSVENLRAEREKVEADQKAKENTLKRRRDDLEALEEDLGEIIDQFDLPDDSSPPAVSKAFTELVDLDSALREYDRDLNKLTSEEEALRTELDTVADKLHEIGILDRPIEDSIENATHLITSVERGSKHLTAAKTVAEKRQNASRIEADSIEILSNWDSIATDTLDDHSSIQNALDTFVERGNQIEAITEKRQERNQIRSRIHSHLSRSSIEDAFESHHLPGDGDEWQLIAYERILDEYDGIKSIEEEVDELEDRKEALEEKRESLIENRIELKNEMKSLASDDDVREAHAKIEAGRARLAPLAEEYATLRIGEYFLDELHERFINRTTGPLLDEAAEIFKRITGSTYVDIDSKNEFDDLDFEATLADNTSHQSSELSRATAEQLFLAVRLARIKLHETPLPVLLDDSLTNFDPAHINRTLAVIEELATDTQVFLLTCHPTLLERVERHATVNQYWSVEDGEFSGPFDSPSEPSVVLDQSVELVKGD